MRIVYNDRHVLHAPQEIAGRAFDTYEVPGRIQSILQALQQAGFTDLCLPDDYGLGPVLAVHDADYVAFLRDAYAVNAGLIGGPLPVIPEAFPTRRSVRRPGPRSGIAGYYASDADSPILAQTWEAAYWSAQCALSAADALRSGAYAVYALCRPPGHHAFADLYGGFCYLNNASIAARLLQASGPPGSRVGILDIDFHHGNGTQSIFYTDHSVLYCSLHGHPDTTYPFYSGMEDEHGVEAGVGYNRNWPLPRNTDAPQYLAALEEALAAIAAFAPTYLVISLGFDIVSGDPYGSFALTQSDIGVIGARIAALGLPTLIVQEGGYLLDRLGQQALAFLQCFV